MRCTAAQPLRVAWAVAWVLMLVCVPVRAAAPQPAEIDWVKLDTFSIARTETTIGQFRRFVQATQTRTAAERAGGGSIYEAGWVQKPGWHQNADW